MLHGRKDYNDRIQDSAGLIPDDEPVFLLRAKDMIALEAVDVYLEFLLEEPDYDETIVQGIKAQIDRMKAWRQEHVTELKLPDMPPEQLL